MRTHRMDYHFTRTDLVITQCLLDGTVQAEVAIPLLELARQLDHAVKAHNSERFGKDVSAQRAPAPVARGSGDAG